MILSSIRNFWGRFKQMMSTDFSEQVKKTLGGQNMVSDTMMSAIEEWIEMYMDKAPWIKDDVKSAGIPAVICSEVARLVTLEMDVRITGSPHADFLSKQFDLIRDNLRVDTEYACAGGGIVFKPYVYGNEIYTEVIQANDFYPTSFTNSKITGASFIYRTWKGDRLYTRIEHHEMETEQYHITNRAYVSKGEDSLGKECSLTDVEEWQEIKPEVFIAGLKSPLFAYFRIPIGNTIDVKSPLGVSVYARGKNHIREADEQYGRFLWEYEGGELAIDVSSDMFKTQNGKPELPKGKERLYRANELDAATAKGTDLMKAWAPQLRDEAFIRGLNRILMLIENDCSLSRGTLSDPALVAKTATEIITMKQRFAAQVKDIQKSFQTALDDLIYAYSMIASLYDLAPDGEYTVAYDWDDSIAIDSEAERMRDQQEVAAGLMLPYEYRVKWYHEDEATAKKKLMSQEPTDDDILGFDYDEPEPKEGKQREGNR